MFGFGKTPEPEIPVCLDYYVEGVAELVKSLNLSNLTIICHSFGGRVAIKLASKNLISIKSLIFFDIAGVKPRRSLRYFFNVYKYKILKKLKLNTKKCGSEDYKKLSDVMKKTFVKIVNEDLTPLLPKIYQPTLIIWGKNDKDTPFYMAKILNKKIANSALITLDGGHFCYLEKHFQVVSIIKSFLLSEV